MLTIKQIPLTIIEEIEKVFVAIDLPNSFYEETFYPSYNYRREYETPFSFLTSLLEEKHSELDFYSQYNHFNLKEKKVFIQKTTGLIQAENVFNYINEKSNNFLNDENLSLIYQGAGRYIQVLNSAFKTQLNNINVNLMNAIFTFLKYNKGFLICGLNDDKLQITHYIIEEPRYLKIYEFNELDFLKTFNT